MSTSNATLYAVKSGKSILAENLSQTDALAMVAKAIKDGVQPRPKVLPMTYVEQDRRSVEISGSARESLKSLDVSKLLAAKPGFDAAVDAAVPFFGLRFRSDEMHAAVISAVEKIVAHDEKTEGRVFRGGRVGLGALQTVFRWLRDGGWETEYDLGKAEEWDPGTTYPSKAQMMYAVGLAGWFDVCESMPPEGELTTETLLTAVKARIAAARQQ